MKKFIALTLIAITFLFVGCSSSETEDLKEQVNNLKSENETLKEQIGYYQNGANALITDIRKAHEKNSTEEVLSLAEKLHNDFIGTEEDLEAQEYVQAINKAKAEEEEAKAKAEAEAKAKAEEEAKKTKQEKLRSIIRVTDVKPYNMDYLGGTDLIVNFVNNSDKVIKYITFHCQPFNAVGDPVSCEIKYKNVMSLEHLSEGSFKATGPFAKGEGISGTSRCWSKAWYNSTIDSVKLNSIDIEYTDDSTEKISGEDVSIVIY